LPLEVSKEQWMSSVVEPTSDDPSRVATGRADEQAPNWDGQRRQPAGVPLPGKQDALGSTSESRHAQRLTAESLSAEAGSLAWRVDIGRE
jgi:hypothetical protein